MKDTDSNAGTFHVQDILDSYEMKGGRRDTRIQSLSIPLGLAMFHVKDGPKEVFYSNTDKTISSPIYDHLLDKVIYSHKNNKTPSKRKQGTKRTRKKK